MNQLKKINEDLDKEKIRLSEEIKKLKVRQMFNTALECALGNEYGT